MISLLSLRKFPKKMFINSRNYVLMTRPEDIEEYDYINSLTKAKKVNFSKFRLSSSDISIEGYAYFLPILQRAWLNNYSDDIDDRLDELIFTFSYHGTFDKYLMLLNVSDQKSLLEWFHYLIEYKQEQFFVRSNLNQLNLFIEILERKLLKIR